MATNQVQVQINGKDNLSGVISGIKTNFSALGGIATAASGVAIGAIGAIGAGVGGVIASVANAQDALVGRIGSTATAAQFMGVSFDEAAGFVKQTQLRMSELAATLPGTTADYVAISDSLYDSVIPAFQDVNGVFDEKLGTQALESLASGFGVLQAQAGLTTRQTGAALDLLLSGTASEAQILTTEFGMKNRGFMDSLRVAAEEQGKTVDEFLQASDPRSLLEGIQFAIDRTVTDDLKNALSETTSGVVEGIKTSLFDPNVGLFGALRDIEIDGETTTLESEAALFLSSVAELGAAFGDFLGRIGLAVDPMLLAAKGLRGLTGFVQRLMPLIDALDSLNDIPSVLPQINLTGITDRLATAIPSFIRGLTQAINSLPMEQLGRDIGARLATSFMNFMGSEAGLNTSELLAGIVAQLPGLTLAILQLPIRAFNSIRQFIWSVAGTIGGQILSGLGAITGQVVQGAMNVTTQIGSSLYSLHMQIASFAFNAISGLAGMVIGAVTGGAASVGSAISSAISSLFSRIRSAVSSILSSIPLPSFGGLGGVRGGQAVGRRASGNNLSALNRVIRREEADSGGRAVIANSTEMIIPQRNLGQLVGAIQGGRQQGGSPVTNNFTIVQQPGQPSEELVQQIVRMMSKQSRGQLA